MYLLHANTPPRVRRDATEPSGFTLFLIFFGGVILTGVFGLLLWNANPAVGEGRAFGTGNQVGAGVPAAVGGSSASSNPGASGGGGEADPQLVSKGQSLAQQFGCLACHSTTGATVVGPTWKGLAGSKVDLTNGQSGTADDDYLKESILQPDAKIVKGFQPGIMTGAIQSAESQIQQGDNLDALVAYI